MTLCRPINLFHSCFESRKWRMTPLILVCALLFSGVTSGAAEEKAQPEPDLGGADYSQPWQISSYSTEPGLSQQRFFDIAFTSDGIAWLAADDGLHQFDGYVWTCGARTAVCPVPLSGRYAWTNRAGSGWVPTPVRAFWIFNTRNTRRRDWQAVWQTITCARLIKIPMARLVFLRPMAETRDAARRVEQLQPAAGKHSIRPMACRWIMSSAIFAIPRAGNSR